MPPLDPTLLPREAQTALEALAASAQHHAATARHEMALEHLKPIRKHEAITRIMASGTNPMTGKLHSYSSAETLAETDAEYAQHLAQLRDAVAARITAAAEQRAAELMAEYVMWAPRRAA